MMLEIAIEADGEWDSSSGWESLVRKSAEAAIAESAFPDLARSVRPVELSVKLTSDEEVRSLNAHWRGKILGSGSDNFKYWDELRAGRITEAQWQDMAESIARYSMVVFPAFLWLATWAETRQRERLVTATFIILLGWMLAMFVLRVDFALA